MTWQPWSYTSQFRWIPDDFTDGRIADLAWENNTYDDPYGPEYNILLPVRGSFVVNADFDLIQVRAKNLVEFSAPASIPSEMFTNILADEVDKRFYVRALDGSTEIFTDWYRSPEYVAHPGVPATPSGYSDTIPNAPTYLANTSGPVLWQKALGLGAFYTVMVNIPDRAYTVEVKASHYYAFGSLKRWMPAWTRKVTLDSYPYSITGPFGMGTIQDVLVYGLNSSVSTSTSQLSIQRATETTGNDIVFMGGPGREWAIKLEIVARNAAGESATTIIYSTLTKDENGDFSVSSSPPDGMDDETNAVSGVGVSAGGGGSSGESQPAPAGGGDNYITPNYQPWIIPPEEQPPEQLERETDIAYSFKRNYDVSSIAPAGAVYAGVPLAFAYPDLVPFDVIAFENPPTLTAGAFFEPVSKILCLPIVDGVVNIPEEDLSAAINAWGAVRASSLTDPQPSNPVTEDPDTYNVNYAYFRGYKLSFAAQTAFRLWWYDADGNAIGERSDYGQEDNRQVNDIIVEVPTALIYEPWATIEGDYLAMQTQAIDFSTAWEGLTAWPCRPDTIAELADPPPCGYEFPPLDTWVSVPTAYPGAPGLGEWNGYVYPQADYVSDLPPVAVSFIAHNTYMPVGFVCKKIQVFFYTDMSIVEDPDSRPTIYFKANTASSIKAFELDAAEIPDGSTWPSSAAPWAVPSGNKVFVPYLAINGVNKLSSLYPSFDFKYCFGTPIRVRFLIGIDGDPGSDFWKDNLGKDWLNLTNYTNNTGVISTGEVVIHNGVSFDDYTYGYAWGDYLDTYTPFVWQVLNSDLSGVTVDVISNPSRAWEPVVDWFWQNVYKPYKANYGF